MPKSSHKETCSPTKLLSLAFHFHLVFSLKQKPFLYILCQSFGLSIKEYFLIFLLSTILTASLKASLCPVLLSVFPSSPVATLSLHWYNACPELFWVYLECIWQIFLLKSHLTHFSYYSHWFLFFSDIGFSSTLSFSLILFRFFTWHPIMLSPVGFCPFEL